MDEVAIGEVKIKATKVRDNNGREGYFLTSEDWATVRTAFVSKGAKVKTKESLLPGIKEAFNEIRADLLGIKTLPDASQRIFEL